jgi:hypothetical protein
MDIPEQFNREAPDFAQLNEGEVWGPFVVVHPRLGELLGAQMALLDDRITWFDTDEVGRIITFSEEPKVMEDGSITVEDQQTQDVYTIRPLREDDYANFNLEDPVSLEEIYEMANSQFAPFELEDDEEE